MIKLHKARSLLYRRQILQENIRWKALDEICKISMHLHRSDLSISAKVRQTFPHFSAKFAKISYLRMVRSLADRTFPLRVGLRRRRGALGRPLLFRAAVPVLVLGALLDLVGALLRKLNHVGILKLVNFWQTLRGPLSAVSTPIFRSK